MNTPTWNGRTWQELEQWERDLLPAELVETLNILPTDEQVAHIVAMGYTIHITHHEDDPAIKCATSEGDIYSAPSWQAIAHYARGYELCACGVHEQAFYDEKDR